MRRPALVVLPAMLSGFLFAAPRTVSHPASRSAPGPVAMKAERWDRKALSGVELSGKRLGVVGFGRIGREVAARCRALGL